ncbi:MAG: TPM domain-containing protein [Pyrinomonadaceae bacterium]|nr:TPM domain-containing protein [Pyrinomonadaceae bacterium]
MRILDRRKIRLILLTSGCLALFCFASVTQFAQTKTQLPARTGHVSDFTGVVSEKTRQQLENILANVKQKTGIEFDIAVVASTGGQDIFDFSRDLAEDWGVGSRTSSKKSLLLVLAIDEKTSFTRFSRSVQSQLPEGVLGQMTQLMRMNVEAGQFNEGLEASVRHFVSAMANKLGLNADDFASPRQVDSTASVTPIVTADPTPEKTRPASVSESPVDLSPAAVTTAPAPASSNPTAATGTRSRSVTRDENNSSKTKGPERTKEAVNDDDESEEVELTLTKPVEARVALLKAFLDTHPVSKSRSRATELLVSARAAVGDERLKKGDSAGGIEQLMLAIAEAPLDASERLFSGVISQIPLNLYLRGERAAATNAAKSIEAKFGGDPKHLLAVSGFYLGTEQGSEAVRIAEQVVKIAPNMAEAHQALGLGLHISLRLDEAAAEYKRALELDPNSKAARRSLADLSRALGKSEEALALYRQQLDAEPKDKSARAGLVLSLLDLGRKDEAKVEFDKALEADPRNLALLAGAAYWYAAHNEMDSAITFGAKAIEIEPRYTWSYVAVARALTAQQKPLEAERALRYARQYGKFPTLDYELASTLASTGLYGEASEILTTTFGMKDNQIEARLAGRAAARGLTFVELLAPERRASVFQFTAADSEANAKILKALLTFTALINQGNSGGSINEEGAIAAAREFSSGHDNLRVYRQLYAADQLLRKRIAFQTVYELAQEARSSAEAGLSIPMATLAVQAEEYRELRARAIASGGTPSVAEAPRNVLSNLLRGRIEDLTGWALYHQDKLPEASDHLKRAVNILPEGTPAWRTALWHLGAVLDVQDKKEEALASYIRSYNAGEPDEIRRGVIAQLYKKINGSLAGLDERIGAAGGTQPIAEPSAQPAPQVLNDSASPAVQSSATSEESGTGVSPVKAAPEPSPEKPASPSPEVPTPQTVTPAQPEPTPAPPDAAPVATPTPEALPAAAPSETPARVRETVTVTGRVKDSQGNPLGNIVVVLISPQGTVLASTTDEQGNYSFTVAASTSSRSYRIIPSKDGLTFEPADKVLPVVSDDVKDLDFVGSPVPRPSSAISK